MRRVYALLIILILAGCGGGGSSPKIDEVNSTVSIVDENKSIEIADKNSSITVDDNSSLTDENNSSEIADNNSSVAVDDSSPTDETNSSVAVDNNSSTPDDNNSSVAVEDNSSVVISQILGKAQLGVLSEATVKLYELDDGIKKILATEKTSKGTSIESIGNFNLHLELIKDDKFYVYEVSKGHDYDSDDNGAIDNTPTENKGLFHLLVKGSSLKSAKKMTITVVSEVIYQKVSPFLASDEIESKMLLYSKELVKQDMDGSGSIDIADVLYYDPINGKSNVHDSYRSIILQMIINILNGRNFDINYATDEEGVQQALDSGDYNYIINQLLNNSDAYSTMTSTEINMNIAGAYIGKADYTAYDMSSAIANDSSSLNGFINDITKDNNPLDTLKNLEEADKYYSDIVKNIDCNDTTDLSDEQKASCFNLGLVRLTALSNSVKLLFGGDEELVKSWANGVEINSTDDLNGNSVIDGTDASACAIVYANNPSDNCRDGSMFTYRGKVSFNKSGVLHKTTLLEIDVGSTTHGFNSFYKITTNIAVNNSVVLTNGVCDKNFNMSTDSIDGINYFPCPTFNSDGTMMTIADSLTTSANLQSLFPSGSDTRNTANSYIKNITGSLNGVIDQNNLSDYLQKH